jgi:endogenous inhibitor of DNA gyrase (YacG/DUF329 family)
LRPKWFVDNPHLLAHHLGMARCPICDKALPEGPDNKAFPFCSRRCKMVDLGNWLGETYRIPSQGFDEEEGEPGPLTEESDSIRLPPGFPDRSGWEE